MEAPIMNSMARQAVSAPWDGRRSLVLYDGNCPFCRMSVRWLKAFDWLGAIEFRSFRDADAVPPLDPPLDPARMDAEMHAVAPGGRLVFHGFWAFRHLAWKMPALVVLAPFLYIPGVGWLGQRVYLWIARNRYGLLPCKDGVCALPSPGGGPPG
jgi:predicted DCC family thiol-disulfide oxidoreductase YuxK